MVSALLPMRKKLEMLHRILEQMSDLLVLAFISIAIGVAKVIATPDPNCWKCRIGTVLMAAFVGTLAGALALQYQFGDYTALTVSSLASLLSRDIVMGILNNRQAIGALIRRAAVNLTDKFTR